MRLVSILLAFIAAPIIGMGIGLYSLSLQTPVMAMPLKGVQATLDTMEKQFQSLGQEAISLSSAAAGRDRQLKEQEQLMGRLSVASQEYRIMSDQIYEQRILAMLGQPVGVYSSSRVEIKVFKLVELGYRGFIAKVKLFDPSTFKVVLAEGGLGKRETTGSAVARTGSILGVNGGGFYTRVENGREKAYPIGNTVIDGVAIGGFHSTESDVFFSGIRKNGELIGGHFADSEEFTRQDPWQGVSFLPILLKDGRPVTPPEDWRTTKEPRTIIGEYANGDLILIVVDGRQSDWSSGVTLERLQSKLAELGVKEGYNLDGGGSSTFIFKGEVLNRPSDGRQRPVVTNILVLP